MRASATSLQMEVAFCKETAESFEHFNIFHLSVNKLNCNIKFLPSLLIGVELK